jgi:hypothetical protein
MKEVVTILLDEQGRIFVKTAESDLLKLLGLLEIAKSSLMSGDEGSIDIEEEEKEEDNLTWYFNINNKYNA